MDDAEWYLRHFSTPEIIEGQGFPAPANMEAARDEVREYMIDLFMKKEGFRWGITLKDSRELIGSCGFFKWRREYWSSAELGYDLDPKYWGRVIMREALTSIIEFAFKRMMVHRIEVLVMPQNLRSVRLIESLGFTKEGLMREHSYFDGRYIDDALYALLEQEWRTG
jgi:ribosomal-protein-alanine N-acetyltransferase